MNYLSEEEQYKRILNNEEISRIKDQELREIRQKYWDLKHKAFLDEKNISDIEINDVHKQLVNEEMRVIEDYKKRKKNKYTSL